MDKAQGSVYTAVYTGNRSGPVYTVLEKYILKKYNLILSILQSPNCFPVRILIEHAMRKALFT